MKPVIPIRNVGKHPFCKDSLCSYWKKTVEDKLQKNIYLAISALTNIFNIIQYA